MTQPSTESVKTASRLSTVLPKPEDQADLTLEGSLNPLDYIVVNVADEKTVKAVQAWSAQQKESTRTKLAMTLVKFLGCSLMATFLLMGVAAFNPNADKTFIKDLVPQAITPQVTLLGVALGYYFGAKDED